MHCKVKTAVKRTDDEIYATQIDKRFICCTVQPGEQQLRTVVKKKINRRRIAAAGFVPFSSLLTITRRRRRLFFFFSDRARHKNRLYTRAQRLWAPGRVKLTRRRPPQCDLLKEVVGRRRNDGRRRRPSNTTSSSTTTIHQNKRRSFFFLSFLTRDHFPIPFDIINSTGRERERDDDEL